MSGRRTERVMQRDQEIWKRWIAGESQAVLAQEYGVSQMTVSKAVRRVRSELPEREVSQERLTDLERLDALMGAAMPKALEGNSAAIKSVLSVMERRAKLLGLDTPTRIDHGGSVSYEFTGVNPEDVV